MCRKIAAIFLIIIFVPLTLLVVYLWSAKLTLLNKNYYLRQLDKINFYEKIMDVGPKFLVKSLVEKGGEVKLTTKEAEEIFRKIFSQSWLEDNYKLVINQFFNSLNGETGIQEAKIDLKELKKGLNDALPVLLEAQIASLPICGEGEQYNKEELNCRPQGKSSEDLIAEAMGDQEIQNFTKDIPDTYDLGDYFAKNMKQIGSIASGLNIFYLSLYILTGFCLLLLLIVGLLIFKPAYLVLRYLGVALLIPGILLLSSLLFNIWIPLILNSVHLNLTGELSPLINSLLFSLIGGYFWMVTYFALGFIVIATTLLVLAKIYKPKTVQIPVK